MLLESTETPPKRSHSRKPAPVEAAPVAPKRSRAPKAEVPPKLNNNAIARAELVNTLATLISRAKSPTSRKWVTYAIATRAVSLNETWREESKKALVACGALPDYSADPLPIGTQATIYSDPLVIAGVQVNQQANRIRDVDAFFAALEAAGLTKRVVRQLRKTWMTDFNGAHVITAMLTS
jgi:hypothetical protein